MNKYQTTRRGLVLGSLAVMAAGCAQTVQQVVEPISPAFAMDPRYARQRVKYQSSEKTGSIVVDTSDRFLYYVITSRGTTGRHAMVSASAKKD